MKKEEELQILQDFERGEFESIRNFREENRAMEKDARQTLQKDKRKRNPKQDQADIERLENEKP
jgi:hypothetical protein